MCPRYVLPKVSIIGSAIEWVHNPEDSRLSAGDLFESLFDVRYREQIPAKGFHIPERYIII